MSNIFSKIGDFFHKIAHWVTDPATVSKAEAIFNEVSSFIPQATQAAELVNSLVPTRAGAELIALGQKYALHVTPEILADPIQVETLLQNAALKELQKVAPAAQTSVLRTAISAVINLFHAKTA